jgi:hypothetical protein
MRHACRVCASHLHNGQPAQLALSRCVDALQKKGGTDAHEIDKVGVLNEEGRKRGPRKEVGFPVAGLLFGASTPLRLNGTDPLASRGTARGGYIYLAHPSRDCLSSACEARTSSGDPSSASIEKKLQDEDCADPFHSMPISTAGTGRLQRSSSIAM